MRPPRDLKTAGDVQGDKPVVEGLALLNEIVLIEELFQGVMLPVQNAIHLHHHPSPRPQSHEHVFFTRCWLTEPATCSNGEMEPQAACFPGSVAGG